MPTFILLFGLVFSGLMLSGWYVDTDEAGNVIGLYAVPQRKGQPTLAEADVKVQTYKHPPTPDGKGFEQALAMCFQGDLLAVNTLAKSYPIMTQLLRDGNWPAVELLLKDANTSKAVTTEQYACIQTAASSTQIPVTLP